ncbi:hypothetical protein LTS10_000682 [Elasticomyces elasticus]|nr:hypothetical protein LTS10_000682 [Elasticomyces elasticus]
MKRLQELLNLSAVKRSPIIRHALEQVTPTKQIRESLLDTYKARIDTVFKPLHWPSTRALVEKRYAGDHVYAAPASAQALESAIYFTAACSLSDNECEQLFGRFKTDVVDQYCSATERHLTAADTMQAPDVTKLQAFVLYLQGLRMHKGHALSWTFVAVAVRLASALGLGTEMHTSAFQVEIRRRLWYCICLMDTQATLDRGSVPLVPAKALGIPPLIINDTDLSPSGVNLQPMQRPALDMLFSSMVFDAMCCHKTLCAIESPHDGWRTWRQKVELVAAFEQSTREKYCMVDDASASPIEIFTKYGAQSICVNMQLLLRRPPYRQEHNAVPPWDDFDCMHVATEVLERDLRACGDPTSPWAWKEWTPWYCLAIVLAELLRTPAGPMADRSYTAACATFRRYAPTTRQADTRTVWKPIAKLLHRVNQMRSDTSSGVLSTVGPSAVTSGSAGIDSASALSVNANSNEPHGFSGDSSGLLDPASDIDWDMWFVDAEAGADTLPNDEQHAFLNMLDLNPEHGVSFLDWDLLL